ncbi:uncharacterized protein PHALS_05072 [Plasmopara halstedii]|uniref:Uncharacterized protein n=1 Tax=Plasmopara halstedii TaxID=4781 RepID=A0A0P1AAW1_PLAHL|nr:uncharacterized protein PHALS_05072 [Plasmopara halstedii]CEG37481.1 hypothetical protein PHALS_05072 [Plasmopara halstedii]|eukprot:XP_024573850.1 hypothetical protein PHALS_05072 [Plasmopara halstedii]
MCRLVLSHTFLGLPDLFTTSTSLHAQVAAYVAWHWCTNTLCLFIALATLKVIKSTIEVQYAFLHKKQTTVWTTQNRICRLIKIWRRF